MSIRVLIADDEALVRRGFTMILDAEPDLEVVGEAADGHAAVELATNREADIVLMDIRMPGMDGIEATATPSPGRRPQTRSFPTPPANETQTRNTSSGRGARLST